MVDYLDELAQAVALVEAQNAETGGPGHLDWGPAVEEGAQLLLQHGKGDFQLLHVAADVGVFFRKLFGLLDDLFEQQELGGGLHVVFERTREHRQHNIAGQIFIVLVQLDHNALYLLVDSHRIEDDHAPAQPVIATQH